MRVRSARDIPKLRSSTPASIGFGSDTPRSVALSRRIWSHRRFDAAGSSWLASSSDTSSPVIPRRARSSRAIELASVLLPGPAPTHRARARPYLRRLERAPNSTGRTGRLERTPPVAASHPKRHSSSGVRQRCLMGRRCCQATSATRIGPSSRAPVPARSRRAQAPAAAVKLQLEPLNSAVWRWPWKT